MTDPLGKESSSIIMSAFVPFSARGSEWQDLKPVPQNDPPNSVVPIDYPPEYREVMDYFRAVLAADERSERALRLTTEAIELNPANYTAWHFRRRCLESLGNGEALLRQEVQFINHITADNTKNYQLWYHRQAVVGLLGDASGELSFLADILSQDAKNYHAFSYRQWLLKRFSLWESELSYVEVLLAEDPRNNSAWNQRWFVITNTNNHELSVELVSCEVGFALSYIDKDPHNESPWNYLKGLLRKGKGGVDGWREARERVAAILAAGRHGASTSVPLHSFLVEALEREGGDQGSSSLLEEAAQLCDVLASELDVLRAKYWVKGVAPRINTKMLQLLQQKGEEGEAEASTTASSSKT